jgi:parallel beta-helix repeat protein
LPAVTTSEKASMFHGKNLLKLWQQRVGDGRGRPGRSRKRSSLPLLVEGLEQRTVPSTYYVAPTGNDSNAGTSTAPFLTIQQGANTVQAGDTVVVRAGNYAGFIMGWNTPTAGTATKPITFEADPNASPGSVVINARNVDTAVGIDLEPGCDYITLQGFTITNGNGSITKEGIKATGSHDSILNNTVTGVGGQGIFANNAPNAVITGNTVTGTVGTNTIGHGIYITGDTDNAVVANNVIHDNGYIGIHINGSGGTVGVLTGALIKNNLIYNNGQNGINADGLQTSTIVDNLIYGYQSYGIVLFQGDSLDGSKNNIIVNNTIVGTATGSGAALRIENGATGNTVLNNVLLGKDGNALRISNDSMPGLVSDYNAVSNSYQSEDTGSTESLAQWQSATGQDKHSFTSTAAALFNNPNSNDYHLKAGSPAIDVGTATDAPATDLDGNPRPQGNGYDIGSYEYPSGTSSAATHLGVAGPSSTTAGNSFSLTVTALNANNQTATSYTGKVHFTSSDTQAVLPADYTFTTSDAGVHTFTVTLKTAGSDSVTATDTVSSSITGSATVTVNPAAASALVFAGYPSPTTAGTSNTFTVAAKDAYGNVASGYTGKVHFTSSDTQAVLPADYTYTTSDAGVHTFSATLKTAGSRSLTATDTTSPSITGSVTVTVNPAAASALVFAGYPSPTTAGTSNTFTVTAKDTYGNVATGYTGKVHFTSNDAQAVLPADYTYTTSDAGVHTFSATFNTGGSQSLTVQDAAAGFSTTQSGITVNAVAHLGVSAPSSATAGNAFTITVTALDANNQTASGYTGTAHFTSSDGQAVLPADYTYTTADAGVHTFTVTLKTAGSDSVTATDTVSSSITGNASVTVNPAAASALVFAGYPSPTTAGTSNNFTVTAKDAYGNVASGYAGKVHFTSSDTQAVLPADYTYTSSDAGVHTFNATLKTAGSRSLTATDTTSSSITGSVTVTVNPAAASALVFAGYPSPTTAGTSNTFTVTAKDAYGNVASGYTGKVHFTSNDAQAVLPADYTYAVSDAGMHTFNATLKTAGSRSITATDTAQASITGSATVTVNPAVASSLVLGGYPSPTTAGTANNFTVTAKDAYGNVASGYTGKVHFTSNDAQAVLPADYTYAAGDAGVHTFNATLKTAGSQGITATDTASSSITGSATVTVNPAAASSLNLTGFPSPIGAGVAQNFTVTAKDAYGNVASGYSGTVHFTSSDAQAVLPADYTYAASDAGMHTFSATLNTGGSQSLTAQDAAAGFSSTQAGITVNSATHLGVSAPSSATAGNALTITVTALDANNQPVSGYTGKVHFTSSDTQAVLAADYTFTAADGGVHSFSVTLKTAGGHSLTATDTALSSITGSATVTVNPAVASSLVLAIYSSPTAGVARSFTVTAKDAYGNVASGYTGKVRFTSSDAQALLPADYTYTATDAGVHSFSATLKTAGSESVTATDKPRSSVTGSATVNVSPGAASAIVLAGYPSSTVVGVAQSFTVRAKDAYGNVATGFHGTVSFISSDPKAVLPAAYTYTANDAGVHTFGAAFETPGTQSLTGTDPPAAGQPVISSTQAGIKVSAVWHQATPTDFNAGTYQSTALANRSSGGVQLAPTSRRTFHSKGTFISRVYDATRPAIWGTASWEANLPAGTRIVVQTRSGKTRKPTRRWSRWATVTNGGQVSSTANRYLQYRLILTSSDHKLAPVLLSIDFTWS